ncbi:sigma-70 family RNA polymerase sigma factor [Rubritalea tangerina]|uniref:Sigma-70 family RNA polymerase sigma factor n=1 Tax=Rubritalea tangerina TaxID=430798 RepID=A0ABW4Z9Q6_9BACT
MSTKPEHQREFISLITEHQAVLRAYIISLMPGSPYTGDVLQETNLVLWEKMDQFQPGSNFRAWAFTIARFQSLNYRRKLEKQGARFLSEDLADILAEQTIEEAPKTERRIKALELCLGKLKAPDRELIERRYHSDKDLNTYAEEVGRTAGALRVNLHRLRNNLRKCITARLRTSPLTP